MPVEREWVEFAQRSDLRAWLAANHEAVTGVWAVYPKAKTGLSDLSWDAVVEECLCFGWIDSLPGAVDALRTRTYIAPRKRRSGWSRRNKQIVERLIAAGAMQPPGLLAIERAQADGSWALFDLAEDLVIPPELEAALLRDAAASEGFAAYPVHTRKAILQWLYSARTPETRIKRVGLIVGAGGQGRRPKGF